MRFTSVDALTGGRFVFGVGAGWLEPEIRNHGVDPARRFAVMKEHIEAAQRIWTRDEADYHGEFVSFDPIWSWPKPARRPYPPVLVGGTGPRVFDRVLSYGDGWLPNYGLGVLERVRELFQRAGEEGRTVRVVMMSVPSDPAVLEECEKAGVDAVLPWGRPRRAWAASNARWTPSRRRSRRCGGNDPGRALRVRPETFLTVESLICNARL
ncbi:LLM class flavin-dependent oxidoreductase [Streptosporangium canum]|uniref:LLM class flavin-dependent oxidoreductase n=1 Tax=Streptosporangium canum TaxID=324952 RepID=UPI0037A680AC